MKRRDPNTDFGFHAVIPRIIRTQYRNLSPTQKWLYVCLKDLCGEHGTCFRTLDVLAEETGISKQMLSASIPVLHQEGMIHAEKKKRAASSTKGVWHITIVDVWQANGKEHPTKKQQGEYSPHEYSHDESSPHEYSNRQVEYPTNGYSHDKCDENIHTMDKNIHTMDKNIHKSQNTETLEDASDVPADAQNEVVSSINRSSIKKKEEEDAPPPPRHLYPSEQTLPSASLFPSQDAPPVQSHVPAPVQAVHDAWQRIEGRPVPLTDKLIQAAKTLAALNATPETLPDAYQWMLDADAADAARKKKPLFYDEHRPIELWDMAREYPRYLKAMAFKQRQAQRTTQPQPGVGISGRKKFDIPQDWPDAIGGN